MECAVALPLELGLAKEIDGGLDGKRAFRRAMLTKISAAHLASP